jgi:hypothetical protein
MRTGPARRWNPVVAVALPVWLAACGDPVVPDPHAEVRGTYDMVLAGGQPLPYMWFVRLNGHIIESGTLELRANRRFIHTVNGVETTGEYGVHGDTLSLRWDGEQLTHDFRREGAALVYPYEGAPGSVWVREGQLATTPFQYERFRMTAREAPADSLPMLASDFWLWESGRYDTQSHLSGSHVWRESGTFTVEGDSLLRFDPAISLWNESEGVLTGERLRIGAVTYEKH